jgi:REP element-mobilizing transposase RayT
MYTQPLAYFISFRTFGTWLHGDVRGSVDRRHNHFGAPMLPPRSGLWSAERRQMAQEPIVLDAQRRAIVERTVREVCQHRGWALHAVAVQAEHVHVVLGAAVGTAPEQVMTTLKSWATRRMVEDGALAGGVRNWSRHGSTRYLWTAAGVRDACCYVVEGQGEALNEWTPRS